MQKLSKNVCGSIIAWTNEGNFYAYSLPLKFSSLFLSFQSNIKSFFLKKVSKDLLGSFNSAVPLIIYRENVRKSDEDIKDTTVDSMNNKNNKNFEIKISESADMSVFSNKMYSPECIKRLSNSNEELMDNTSKKKKYRKNER